MESDEANPSCRLPTGRSALAAAIALCVGVGLILVCVLVDRALDVPGHEMQYFQVAVGGAGLLGVYLVAPLLGLIAVSSARGWWQEIVAAAIHEHPSVRTMARRSLIAGLLFAAAPLVPSVVSIVSSIPLQYVPLSCRVVGHVVIALLGLAMGWISLRLFWRIPGARLSRTASVCAVVIGLASVTDAFGLTGLASYLGRAFHTLTRQQTFADDSGLLERTAIVPTLDSPCPPGKNVIWCSSFQLAWNELRDNVIGGPLEVIGAEELAERLNRAKQSRADLEPRSVYATAGRLRDGIVSTIRKDMSARFPPRSLPDFSQVGDVSGGIIAYSYLTANVPFTHPFRQVDEGFTFTDSQGVRTNVSGFGLWEAFLSRYENIREQVEILYVQWDEQPQSQVKEYALDLCRHSAPYQVVVARVDPKDSLAETLDYLRTRIEDFHGSPDTASERHFGPNDKLRIPEMFWRIDHRFRELIGKTVANVEVPIVEALQTIEFRLDRSGAILESNATLVVLSGPRHFEFNRPFLIYMKKRDADRPFFVMWVDNAELLVRK